MPKRRRLFTPNKNKIKSVVKLESKSGQEVNTARGRLMGALMDVLDPSAAEGLDVSHEPTPTKQERETSSEQREYLTDEEAKKCLRRSPAKQPYVLKLFDRSVDLSQFREDAPLYPICRAWITNQPKANYSTLASEKSDKEPEPSELLGTVELSGPEGPPVSRVPDLIPEQLQASKDNINLNYREAPPPTKEQLLRSHLSRWTAVRQSWLDQGAKVESRYEATQQVLNKINIEYMNSR